MKVIDLVGMRFDRLVVVGRASSSKFSKARFNCRCDCGNVKVVMGEHLRRGLIKSCGCFRVEFGRAIGQMKTHGQTDTPEYSAWANMLDRCYNENNKSYRRYGGRGISVCHRWRDS